ncbi:MAG: RsmB/NOP family class I SAM-dependent RNA methyltransferase, partial [Dongiaceae bacterium]
EGAWWVQDAAAALPARLLGPVAGLRVVDLCAAPGGKTAQLAAAGADVTAVDRSAARLERLAANLARLHLTARIVAADAAQWRPPAPAEAVLLDAPCTATGTIRRHPDIPWLKTADDLAKLVPLQDRLLAAAVEMTAPGGVLVYCVCSLQPEEGPQRIAALLAAGAPVAPLPIDPAEIGGLAEAITGTGELRTLPCHLAGLGGLDGFYAARLRRR